MLPAVTSGVSDCGEVSGVDGDSTDIVTLVVVTGCGASVTVLWYKKN